MFIKNTSTVGDYVRDSKEDGLAGKVFQRKGDPAFGYNLWRVSEVYICSEGEARVSAEVQISGGFRRFGDLGALHDLLDWEEVLTYSDEFSQ